MTGHRTLLYSHYADVGNRYNCLRTMTNIHLNMNEKPSMLEEYLMEVGLLFLTQRNKESINGSSRGIHITFERKINTINKFVIPKSCHHHVIRPLTYLLALKSQHLEWRLNGFLSIYHTNSQHRSSSLIQERYPCSHRFSLVVHKWCHRLSPLVHRKLLPEPLCQRRRSAVPWVKG